MENRENPLAWACFQQMREGRQIRVYFLASLIIFRTYLNFSHCRTRLGILLIDLMNKFVETTMTCFQRRRDYHGSMI